MMSAQIEIQLIAVVVAIACALPGVFLILRGMAMMSDAISHAILFGIVIGFLIVRDISSPILVVAATLTGLLTVALVELLNRTRLVKEDAAIGLVFPLLFSIGVVLIAQHAGNVHLDTDAVLLGELAFAPFNRLHLFGSDIGPKALYEMGGILLLNLLFILLFYKELKLATFDAGMAAALGFSPVVIHYGLMSLVSVTAVGAFDAVGSILVVALMVGTPATARLLTHRLKMMLWLSAAIGATTAFLGYWMAHIFDVSIAGSMATTVGLLFLLAFLLAPEQGLLAQARRRHRQKLDFALEMLTVHILNHQGLPEAMSECRVDHLDEHLHWRRDFIDRIVALAEKQHLVQQKQRLLYLTPEGQALAEQSLTRS